MNNGDDKDPDEEPRSPPSKETKKFLAREREIRKQRQAEMERKNNGRNNKAEKVAKNRQADNDDDNCDDFNEVLRKASNSMGHSRLKAKRWIREQKKKGQARYNQEQKAIKKREQSTDQSSQSDDEAITQYPRAGNREQTENVKQNASENKTAECCKKAKAALQQAIDISYGTLGVS